MCHDPSATPPSPPVTGHRGETERVVLRSADGAEPAATLARTTRADAAGVVVVPDVRGLQPYYEHLAEAFADAGAHALAVDYYARSAGTDWRDAAFDYAPHRAVATDAGMQSDITAAVRRLRAESVRTVLVVGFCMGGRAALLAGANRDVGAVVGFYPFPGREGDGGRSPLRDAQDGSVHARVLALYGGADEGIPAEHRDAYEAALRSRGRLVDSVVYEGAPHSFFDRTMAEHAEACADAWRRILDLLDSL